MRNEKIAVIPRKPSDVTIKGNISNNIVFTEGEDPTLVNARSLSITAPPEDYPQYVNVVKTFTVAGMTYQPIINVALSKGHPVTVGETTTFVQGDFTVTGGQVLEEESRVRAWQKRGETIVVNRMLPSPTTIAYSSEIPIPVLEGIEVNNAKVNNLGFIRPLTDAELKKAA